MENINVFKPRPVTVKDYDDGFNYTMCYSKTLADYENGSEELEDLYGSLEAAIELVNNLTVEGDDYEETEDFVHPYYAYIKDRNDKIVYSTHYEWLEEQTNEKVR